MPAARRPLLFFGEILWDMVPHGAQPGGATANVAVMAHACGANALLVSAVGSDASGTAMLEQLRERGLPTNGIQTSETLPTGAVDVALSDGGQPSYTIRSGVAWDAIGVDAVLLQQAANAKAFYFGSLAQRSAPNREILHQLLAVLPQDCVRFFDVNLRSPLPEPEVIRTSLAHTDVFKLNEDELPAVAALLGLPTGEADFAEAVFTQFPVRTLLLTKGAAGALIYAKNDAAPCPALHIPAGKVAAIANTVGAGDAFSAGFIVATVNGLGNAAAAAFGSSLAAKICQCDGAWLPAGEKITMPFAQ